MYIVEDLDTALQAALKKRESELRWMEARTRELQELAKQQRFRPSDEVATFKILKSIKEVIATTVPIILSAKEEFLWLSNREGVEFSEVFGILQQEREFIEREGQCRGITEISYRLIDTIRHLLDIGADVRHFGDYRGAYFGVFDKKYCIRAINIDVQHRRLDASLSMFYTDDPVFADYLVSTFEMFWKQAVTAEERIQELLEQRPQQA